MKSRLPPGFSEREQLLRDPFRQRVPLDVEHTLVIRPLQVEERILKGIGSDLLAIRKCVQLVKEGCVVLGLARDNHLVEVNEE